MSVNTENVDLGSCQQLWLDERWNGERAVIFLGELGGTANIVKVHSGAMKIYILPQKCSSVSYDNCMIQGDCKTFSLIQDGAAKPFNAF